jgi:hypothetical protein
MAPAANVSNPFYWHIFHIPFFAVVVAAKKKAVGGLITSCHVYVSFLSKAFKANKSHVHYHHNSTAPGKLDLILARRSPAKVSTTTTTRKRFFWSSSYSVLLLV